MQGSKIQTIEIYKIKIPLKEPFVISLGPINDAENIVVIIRTADGCAGYGESSPYMTINGESVDTGFIVGQYFAKVLKGKNALEIEACVQEMDKIIYGNSSIKSAFDIALYDIAAQHAGLPLYQFLGGKKNKTLVTDMTIGMGEPDKMRADAEKYIAEGFKEIKVKLGQKDKDVERIKAVREAIGTAIPLRVDANQGWKTADEAIEVLKAIAPYDIQHCEEPIPRWLFMDLKKVSDASPIPIMADESLGDEHDAARLIQLQACKMLNIKLGKSSGILKAQRIIALGAKAGMELQIGGFMESRLGMTAAAHLALTNDAIIHCDFDTPLMYIADPVIGGIEYKEGGVIEVPDIPGLGAAIDDAYLQDGEKVVL